MINANGPSSNKQITALQADVTQRAINVKTPPYNATGNGVTNDYAAIQTAFTDAAATGRKVIIPVGDFYIGSNILLPPSNITIEGVSKEGSRIIGNPPNTESVISISAGSNIRISNLTVRGSKPNNTAVDGMHSIEILDSSSVTVNDCILENMQGDGVLTSNASHVLVCDNEIRDNNRSGMSIVRNADDIVVERNYVHGCRLHGINAEVPSDTYLCSNIHYRFNRVYGVSGTSSSGLLFSAAGAAVMRFFNCSMEGNYVSGYTEGMTTRAFKGVKILGNDVEDCLVFGSFGNTPELLSLDLTIDNNRFIARSGSTNDGLAVVNVDHFVLAKNIIKNAGRYAIPLAACRYGFVSGNEIISPAQRGIDNQSTATDITYQGNLIKNVLAGPAWRLTGVPINLIFNANTVLDDQGTKTTTYAIQASSTQDRLIITGNNFYRLLTGAFTASVSGATNSQIANNMTA